MRRIRHHPSRVPTSYSLRYILDRHPVDGPFQDKNDDSRNVSWTPSLDERKNTALVDRATAYPGYHSHDEYPSQQLEPAPCSPTTVLPPLTWPLQRPNSKNKSPSRVDGTHGGREVAQHTPRDFSSSKLPSSLLSSIPMPISPREKFPRRYKRRGHISSRPDHKLYATLPSSPLKPVVGLEINGVLLSPENYGSNELF